MGDVVDVRIHHTLTLDVGVGSSMSASGMMQP